MFYLNVLAEHATLWKCIYLATNQIRTLKTNHALQKFFCELTFYLLGYQSLRTEYRHTQTQKHVGFCIICCV